ncbi:MAG: putative rane protein [Patescibacteria group bacterium]|nr:phage holin family protein [Candidatus Saccharibacteria bacterium]MDQ5963481.1 putative rane protein [Patescibacteria group bacterium]
MTNIEQGFLYRFSIRWIVCSLGLWIAAGLFNDKITYDSRVSVVLISGFLLALMNAVLKPILVVAALPALLLTLGLFMLIINGATVYLVSKLYTPLHITSFTMAVVTGLIIGLVNYLVTAILERP